MEVTVTVPMDPPSKLMPNQAGKQSHWGTRAKLRKESREVAKYAAMEARGQMPTITGPVEVIIHAGYGYNRRLPDLDATSSAAKAFLDGIVDAGILYDDDQVQRLIVTHEKLKTRKHVKPQGYTRFIVREMQP